MPGRSELLGQLAKGVLELTSTPAWERWLRVSQRFHHYSFPNQVLILSQRPGATWVAGYRTWARLGRQVRRGERGIRILAPCFRAEPLPDHAEPPALELAGFRIAHVFDLGQTEGRELASPVRPLEGPGPGLAVLLAKAEELGFEVQFSDLGGGRNGDCSHSRRLIRVGRDLAPAHRVKTLAHELGHALLHGPDLAPLRPLAELEAESVAYIACQELGIDSGAYSFGYLATWAGSGAAAAEGVAAAAGRILGAAQAILPAPTGGQPEQ